MSDIQSIKLRILSPVHIGSGDELTPAEYYYNQEGKCIILNLSSLTKDDAFKPFFEQYLTNTAQHIPISNYIPIEILQRHVLYQCDVDGSARDKLASHSINIKSCIKTAGNPFMPGSSVKGSILSALFWYILKGKCEEERSFIRDLEYHLKTQKYNDMLNIVISEISQNGINRFASWLRVSDSKPVKPGESLKIYCAQVEGARTQGKLPVLYEAINESVEFELEMDLTNCSLSFKNILDAIFGFYNGVYNLDMDYPTSSDWEPTEDTILLRLGQGSTAFATSLLVLANDLKIQGYKLQKPRTRKRIDGIPMGWVEVVA